MNSTIFNRISKEVDYMIDSQKTIREIAKKFNMSKSTVHKDLHQRLKGIDEEKYRKIEKILKHHINVRHIRGGESTKLRYLNIK